MKKIGAAVLMTALALSGCSVAENNQGQNQSDTMGTAIDLSRYDDPLTIDTAGVYTLSGDTRYPVTVDVAAGEVTLYLNGVTITTADTAGLVALNGDKLNVYLMEGTENTVSDGGADEDYDAAIFSKIPLHFDGSGKLTVNGNYQEGIATKNADLTFDGGEYTVISADDGINAGGEQGGEIAFNGGTFYINASGDGIDSNANIVFNGGEIRVIGSAAGGNGGIDCDDGYVINGGSIVAMGTDMPEMPLEASAQNFLAFTLEQSAAEGSRVVLAKTDGTEVVSFTANQAFRTLLISNPALEKGSYTLSVNGTQISVNGVSEFTVDGVRNTYGGTQGKFSGEPPKDRPEGQPPKGRPQGEPDSGQESA